MLGTDAAAIARLRASLAGFKRALEQEGYVPKAGERPAALDELDPADPLAVLIPLFLLELPVARADAERVVDVVDAVELGAAGVELRSGNWLEPVAGERFDLVVCNPPFVISPESRYTYRSGLPADELVRRLVADLLPRLEEGGTAQLLLSWIVRVGESWADPVAGLPQISLNSARDRCTVA